MERLQKIIANSGIASRRKAEQLILEGKVKVNGEVIDSLGYKASFNDEITIDNKVLKLEEKVVYLLNKPKNVISSAKDDKDRTTVVDLIDSKYRIYPLGRLDYDSEGLILLSNDGELMQKLTHPKNKIEKLEKGVKIDNYISAPATIKLLKTNDNKKTSFLLVTIHEGKNRQIRKMFKQVGYNVIKLKRIKEANISLGNLKSGQYRLLKPFEVKQLKKYLDTNNI